MAFNLITLAAAGATGVSSLNITLLIGIITFCLTTMATLIKLFGPKSKISDQNLRESQYLQGIEGDVKAKEDKLSALKELISEQHTEVEKLKIESKNNTKSLEELKQDNRDLVQRLDHLLKQFMEYMDG
jgi:biopolymer transport protein ExbB/TolQ